MKQSWAPSWLKKNYQWLIGTIIGFVAIFVTFTTPEIRKIVGLTSEENKVVKDTNDLQTETNAKNEKSNSPAIKGKHTIDNNNFESTSKNSTPTVNLESDMDLNKEKIQRLVDEARNQKETSIQAAYNSFQKAFLLLPEIHSPQYELNKIKKIYSFETQVEYLDSIFLSLKY